MLLLNYAHPLTDEQRDQLVALLGQPIDERRIATSVERARPLADVARALVDAAALSGDEWQTLPLVINPPSLAPVALAVIAEIHGRCGYFPPMVNIRPVEGGTAVRYEVGEVVNLQAIRLDARDRRVAPEQ